MFSVCRDKKRLIICLLAVFITVTAQGAAMAEQKSGFRIGRLFESDTEGTIHYNIYIPESYDGSRPYALHLALPGWEGLYFHGAGKDLQWEFLPHESPNYVPDMIVVSAQLTGWNTETARQAIALTRYIQAEYNIDPDRIYISGYSAGGEALSLVMELEPELYAAALFVSSQWDGNPQKLVTARTPLYIFTSEHDAWYGAEPARIAWQTIHDLYLAEGLSEEEISSLLVLDIREDAWFDRIMVTDPGRTGTMYASDYHGAGMLVAFDETVMKWVFTHP